MEKWFFSFKIHASGLFECLWKLALVRLHSKVIMHQGIYPRQNMPPSDAHDHARNIVINYIIAPKINSNGISLYLSGNDIKRLKSQNTALKHYEAVNRYIIQ